MQENSFEAKYDITKKTKLRQIYESNKILIYSIVVVFVISTIFFTYYFENKEKQKILLSDSYIQAKVHLEKGEKTKAVNILKNVIYKNDSTYSTLSLFLIINQNLISEKEEISNLFNHLLEENKFDKEIKNLLIFKKAVFESNYVEEAELLKALKPILNSESVWKSHALMLLGDYFSYKNEYLKAKEFYTQILSIKNLERNFYNKALYKITLLNND
tara:strand:- start:193 stop:840 length:648 start_codon:yes stop_codon:yes gene_type:complete